MAAKSYLHFWGKAGGGVPGEPCWHPLAYHDLDVAAVADRLLRANPRKLGQFAKLLGTSPENARRLVVCLVALHDVGKFSALFQAKSQEAWDAEGGAGRLLGLRREGPAQHTEIGFAIHTRLQIQILLAPVLQDWSPNDFETLWSSVAGHHGQPVDRTAGHPGMLTPCWVAAEEYCRDAVALLGPAEPIALPPEHSLNVLSWLLCGLTVVSDWIGSNREWFPYQDPKHDLPAYWTLAGGNADRAVAGAGVSASTPADDLGPERLLPKYANALSPLQAHARDMPLPDGPLLAIIEEVTGSGKTEAALLLAARLMGQGKADGLFFALPTMATANAMYDRLAECCARLYADGAKPSLVLAHGKRTLNQKFTDRILPIAHGPDGSGEGGAAACAAWIADDRRKAFLAHLGVGTIDQALLGVLPSRHQVLRLWGLSDRVLIIDEAHAYDAYMSREMETLLEFHAALGGSAIILSATLPGKQRQLLAAAFAKGLGTRQQQQTASAYPLVTVISASAQTATPLPSRADRGRTLRVRRIASFDDAVAHVQALSRLGCAVAWIRNSVDDAIEAVAALEQAGCRPVLLHARFAMGDRLDIEAAVSSVLGKDSRSSERRGYVVVGTQILEQSLDYDVDAMVTDLAPIDLVIQRAGRLWRHTDRTDRPLTAPELCVLSPDPGEVADQHWYRQVSARAAAVYDHHGIVWRSARELFARGEIETPDRVRELIEAVYGREELDDVPEPLRRASQNAMGNRSAARSIARANLLKLADGYGGSPDLWTADTLTPTRLGQPQTVFRLGKVESGRIVPYYPDDTPMRAWALSEVSLAKAKADGIPKLPAHAALIDAARDPWPTWERDMPLLVLEPDGEGCRGIVTLGAIQREVRYDTGSGLRISN